MKKLIILMFFSIGVNAQFNYQAIVKDPIGNTITNTQVKFKFTLTEISSTSSPVYVEEHTILTPQSGVVNLSVGEGVIISGAFSGIDWSNSVYIKQELDTGSGYQDMGTKQFASVPVAEYAKNTRGISFQNQALFIDELIASSVSITTLSVSNTIEVGNGIISGGTVTATSFAGYGSSLLWSQGSTQTLSEKIDSIESTIASEVASVSEITALLGMVFDLESLVESLEKQLVAIQSSLDNLTEISFETFIDLETKTLDNSMEGPSDSSFDIKFAYNSNDSSTAARIFWNESSAVMALVYDVPYDEIKITDLSNYYFCQHLNDSNSSCENTDTAPTDFVGVIETYEGNYYAIKFISETTSDVIFKYRKL